MAQVAVYPSWIWFYCQVPASKAGATPILRSDVLMKRLTSDSAQMNEFIEKLKLLGVRYRRVMPAEGVFWDTLRYKDF